MDLADQINARLREPGWRPKVETQEVSRENVINMVSSGRFIALTTDTCRDGRIGELCCARFTMSGLVSRIAYSGFWLSDNVNATLKRLLELICSRYPE